MKSQESLKLRLFGVPRLSLAGCLLSVAPKPLALLAHLALNPDGVSREVLAELLWAPGKLHNVRQALYSLRALPGSSAWLDSGDPVVLHAESDVGAFERAVRAGCAAEALAAWDRSTHDRLLFQGVELPDVPAFEDWLEEERRRLHGLYLDALGARLNALHAAGDHAGAVQHAETLIRLDPLSEEGYQAAMRAELKRGQRERAIQLFERCRRVLRDELGAEPAAATLDLLRAVEGESAARGKRAALLSTPDEVPAQPQALYGREAVLAACRARLAEHPQLLVQGFGGMGKTALAATLAAGQLAAGGQVLWLEVGDDGPEAVYDALAAPFDARQQVARGEAKERSAALREVLAASGVGLLVLDDVWNAYSLSRVAEALPPGLQLLATSRQRYPELPRLELERLDRAAALALLCHHAPGLPAHDPRADAVCALLGDHPFALRLAGITLQRQGLELAELLRRLQEQPGELREEGERDLRAVLDLSLERLDDLEYEVFLGMGGLFAPSSTVQLLEILLRRPRSDITTACAGLLSSGLIDSSAAPESALLYRMHDIAWQHARSLSYIRPRSALKSVIELERCFGDDVQTLENELQNIVAAARAAESAGLSDLFSELMESFTESVFVNVRGVNLTLFRLIERSAYVAEQNGLDLRAYRLFVQLGNACYTLKGDVSAAHEAFTLALAAARRVGDPAEEAKTLSSIAMARFYLGLEGAEKLLEEALNLSSSTENHLAQSIILDNLCIVKIDTGNYRSAYQYGSWSLRALEQSRLSGRYKADELAKRLYFTSFNLGEAEIELGLVKEGIARKKDALEYIESGGYTAYAARGCFDLAQVYARVRQPLEAAHYASMAHTRFRSLKDRKSAQEVAIFCRENRLLIESLPRGVEHEN